MQTHHVHSRTGRPHLGVQLPQYQLFGHGNSGRGAYQLDVGVFGGLGTDLQLGGPQDGGLTLVHDFVKEVLSRLMVLTAGC